MKSLSHVRLFASPWTITCQAPPSMGFSWQEYWSGVPLPSPFMAEYYSYLCVLVVQLCPTLSTLWTVAHQAPLSMGFVWQEYWSGLPFPPPGSLPDPGIEPGSPAFQADTLTSEPPGKPHDQPRQHIKKQRHYFANIGLSSESYDFSSSHIRI